MTFEDFDKLLDRRMKATVEVLASKAVEYAPGADRLHNFKRAAAITGESPAEVCVGFMAKHLVSVLDIVDSKEARLGRVPQERIDEKFGDAINYLILLEALLNDVADLEELHCSGLVMGDTEYTQWECVACRWQWMLRSGDYIACPKCGLKPKP